MASRERAYLETVRQEAHQVRAVSLVCRERQCLMGRRLLERGTRFVQIYSGGMENQRAWDGHKDLKGNHSQFAGETDKPIAGLLTDLKTRGLLEDTLVLWGGEFGRTPHTQQNNGPSQPPGREHNHHGFTMWMAGGGVKRGITHGATDDFGYEAVDQVVNMHDLHATLLHALGLDHHRLTFDHGGRPENLTDSDLTGARIVTELLA